MDDDKRLIRVTITMLIAIIITISIIDEDDGDLWYMEEYMNGVHMNGVNYHQYVYLR